ncbi:MULTISPECIES: LysR family transcriptional regulator [unclassified Variovorax]|uniref:LysR family transcriptional regulator n=1 Tax=unclassified Variovorax TaxID=663243 RepID=UPI000D120011|nr:MULTISPECIES: LysR family transcriptional regulator [unclassified Variovorax]AVQ83859.1 LysR family transcriptional regulator [Variovorax sp. PMC12]QRY31780.1 LysR family transcriptional regulator [Variovorax sp. PDNC026]
MKIDILGIQAFVAIADEGSFQAAAGALNVTQTAITQRLRKLEDFLGVALVERTTRSVALTTIGRDFVPRARRLLVELADSLLEIRETGKAERGDVSIACVPTAGVQFLPRIMQAYSARHPHNRIKILDHSSSAVANAVLHREVEFGIGMAGAHAPELQSVPLIEDEYVLICHEAHPLAQRKRIAWRQLEPHPLIFAGHASENRPLLDLALGAAAANLKPFYEVQRSSTAVGLVAERVAAAVVPRLALQKGAYPTLRIVELTEPKVSRTLVLMTRKTARLSPAAQALYDLIEAQASVATAPRRR